MEEETKKKMLIERENYYKQTFVLFEIVKCLKHRELAFLNSKLEEKKMAIRYMLAFNINYLKKHFQRFDFYKSLMNMYHSVVILKPNVPVFSYNFAERREDPKYKEFNDNYADFVDSYNFFIDFDGKDNFEKCLEEAKEFKKVLDEYKLPYYCLNSSFKGFHFCIQAEYMPSMDIKELIEIIRKVIYNIKGVYDFSTLDVSITDLKRIQKCPYSFVCDGSIALPLTDEQLAKFTPDMVKVSNVLKNVRIKNRGLLVKNLDLEEEKLKENVRKFISEFS